MLASTYPRWTNETEPGFVQELSRRLVDPFEVRVLGPHAPGALRQEVLDGVEVRRYRYAPLRLQTLVNDGGIVTNLKRQPWKWLLVPGFVLALFWTTFRQLRRWRPDIVHAHWLIPQGLVIALISLVYRRKFPFLVTSHGTDLNAFRFWPMPALKRFVIHRAAGVTVVSSAMLDTMQAQKLPIEKVSVEPMGVDLQHRFTPGESAIRSRYEILFVGRLVEVKGVRFLVDAMPKIIENYREASLTVAGFGPEDDKLRQQARALGLQHRVNFIGAVSQAQLPALYRRATVFVAPFVQTKDGHQEGLGLVTIEAIGCGCPAVVSDVPATREVIKQQAFRVRPASSQALAASISMVLGMPPARREMLAAEQRKELKTRFDWRTRTESYCRLLSGLRPPS